MTMRKPNGQQVLDPTNPQPQMARIIQEFEIKCVIRVFDNGTTNFTISGHEVGIIGHNLPTLGCFAFLNQAMGAIQHGQLQQAADAQTIARAAGGQHKA